MCGLTKADLSARFVKSFRQNWHDDWCERERGCLTIIASGLPLNLVDPNLAGMTMTAVSKVLFALCDMALAAEAPHDPNLANLFMRFSITPDTKTFMTMKNGENLNTNDAISLQ